MPKAVITGGAGFIGSHLARRLVDSDWQVTVIDDLSHGSLDNLAAVAGNERFTFIEADIRHPKVLETAVVGATCLIHLAAYKIPRYGRALETLMVNNDGLARYKFRPSSPLCPIAVPLALAIRKAVAEVEGVTGQEITVVGYLKAAELNALLRETAV